MYFRFCDLFITSLRLILVGVLALSSTAIWADEGLSVEQAVAEALTRNPTLAAIEARAVALATIPDQVGALRDPRLSIKTLNVPLDSLSFTQEGMTQLQVGLSQMLPYPGKLALRSKAAGYEASAAKSEVAERRLQLVQDIKMVWWNLFYLDRMLEVIARNQRLLEQFVVVAETRYQVGRGLQQDILLAQLERSKLNDLTLRIQNMRENEATRLNRLLDRPVAMPVQLPSSVDEKLPTLQSVATLQMRAETGHPRLATGREQLAAARSRVDLAKKSYAPDFNVGVAYGLRGGDNPDGSSRADFGSIMVSMNLPIYTGRKQDRAVDQRQAQWMQQKYQLEDLHNQIASNVQQAITDYQRAGEQAQLFKQEIIPLARQTVDAMLAGYQVGSVDFLNLVRSQTTLYNYETEYWKALSGANQARARLVAAVGEEKIYE
ncbi:MAG: TolC family protein [Candidatus Polarisedimenticolaceae bacterium]|nr:TolC family protein [Candidatus Polarisedimenticolaceae bacterium]